MASTYGTLQVINWELEALGDKPTTTEERKLKRLLTSAKKKCLLDDTEEFTEEELDAIAEAKLDIEEAVINDSIPYDWWQRTHKKQRRLK